MASHPADPIRTSARSTLGKRRRRSSAGSTRAKWDAKTSQKSVRHENRFNSAPCLVRISPSPWHSPMKAAGRSRQSHLIHLTDQPSVRHNSKAIATGAVAAWSRDGQRCTGICMLAGPTHSSAKLPVCQPDVPLPSDCTGVAWLRVGTTGCCLAEFVMLNAIPVYASRFFIRYNPARGRLYEPAWAELTVSCRRFSASVLHPISRRQSAATCDVFSGVFFAHVRIGIPDELCHQALFDLRVERGHFRHP